jgi:hypothetical protein
MWDSLDFTFEMRLRVAARLCSMMRDDSDNDIYFQANIDATRSFSHAHSVE